MAYEQMMNKQQLITELQSKGLRWVDPNIGASGRKGGAGPSDHKAITIDGTTVMVPIYTDLATRSPYTANIDVINDQITLHHDESEIAPLFFPKSLLKKLFLFFLLLLVDLYRSLRSDEHQMGFLLLLFESGLEK